MATNLTHAELCKLALKWLKRPASSGGHGCQVAIDECRTGWSGEIPDALGFRSTGRMNCPESGAVLVECKVSRSDFLADRNKPHRQTGGIGNWRYFMAPEGVISLEDLPEKWGLIEVTAKRHLKLRCGVYSDTNYNNRYERMVAMRQESDWSREAFLLVRLFDRVQDVEGLLEISKQHNRLSFKNTELSQELRLAESKVSNLTWKAQQHQDELERYRALYGALPD